jgi:hypothetical protein
MLLNKDLFERLRGMIALPPRITALDLRLRVDEIPTVTIEQYAEAVEMDVTHLESKAREFLMAPVIQRKRYYLVEIEEQPGEHGPDSEGPSAGAGGPSAAGSATATHAGAPGEG